MSRRISNTSAKYKLKRPITFNQPRTCVHKWPYWEIIIAELAHCRLVAPCCDIDLDEHWLRQWPVA